VTGAAQQRAEADDTPSPRHKGSAWPPFSDHRGFELTRGIRQTSNRSLRELHATSDPTA
jgi:hypothetical protein